MFSLGFASLTVTGGYASSVAQAFETSTKKFGILLIVLAVSHMINMLILNNMRKSAEQKQLQAESNDITSQYSEAIKNYNKQFGTTQEA